MPKQSKLVKQMNNGYEYWGAHIAGRRRRFGRCDKVAWPVAYAEFLKAIAGTSPTLPPPDAMPKSQQERELAAMLARGSAHAGRKGGTS